MLPLVVPLPVYSDGIWIWSVGTGSELYQGLGAVVLGGMIVSTFFTLVLIPAGFSLVMNTEEKPGCKRCSAVESREQQP